jgi:hypothetical protein
MSIGELTRRSRLKRNVDTTLEPLLASGKPVVVSEFGFLTRTDADQIGSAALVNIDPVTMSLHLLPLTGRLVRPRVKTVHERNEELQAHCLHRQLALLDSAGVDRAPREILVGNKSKFIARSAISPQTPTLDL